MAKQSERGSVFIFLLIGISLFAALSYAVMGSMRLSGGSMSPATEGRMEMALTELRNTVLQSRTAIQMMVAAGYAPDEIDVQASAPSGFYYPWGNSLCGSDNKCKLYHSEGGGLQFFVFSKVYPQFSAVPTFVSGTAAPQGLFWTWWAYKGTLQGDILYRVEITKDFCNFINKKNGITADIDSLPVSSIGNKFQLGGSFTPLASSHVASFTGAGQAPYLAGKNDGCAIGNSVNKYVYVAFVYAR